jgi:transcriptional regulator with XRE-family HTH domain
MESIIEYLKRKLREAGPSRWEAIAAEAGVAKTLPRKLAYDDRENPGVATIQPLLDYFGAVERGERELPEPVKTHA